MSPCEPRADDTTRLLASELGPQFSGEVWSGGPTALPGDFFSKRRFSDPIPDLLMNQNFGGGPSLCVFTIPR